MSSASLEPASAPAREKPAARFLRWAPLMVVAVAWLAHEGARHGDWLLEDVVLVRDDPEISRGLPAVREILAGNWLPSETASGTYGPLARVSFALEAPLWRAADGSLAPTGFHLTNLLLHGLCALLLFRLVVHLVPRRPWLALGAALCFAAHPLYVGTVAPLMGRGELLAVLFSLLTALAWRAYAPGRPGWLALATIAWLLALLSKEIAVGVPLALFVLDRIQPPPGREFGWARWGAVGYAVLLLVPLAIFQVSWDGAGTTLDAPLQGLGSRLLIGLDGLGRMVLLLLLPIGLRGDHTDEAAPGVGYAVEGAGIVAVVAVVLITLGVALRTVRGRAGLPASLWWVFLALALPALALARTGAAYEVRSAYLLALPLLVFAGLILERLATRDGRTEPFTLARATLAGLVGLACLVGLSLGEGRHWQSDEAFHAHLLDQTPSHVRAMVRLAGFQRRVAQDLRVAAARLPAQSPRRRSLLEERREAHRQSLAWARRATRHEQGRQSTDAWRELGLALLDAGEAADALDALSQARELDPVLQLKPHELRARVPARRLAIAADLYHAMGLAREAQGQRESAADAFLTASQLAERRVDYLEHAGLALCRVARFAEGLALLHKAVRLTPSAEARATLVLRLRQEEQSAGEMADRFLREGQSAADKGNFAEAVRLFEQVIGVDPESVEALVRAGWLRGWYFGSYGQAERYLARAEELLREARVGADDPMFASIQGYRRRLVEQKQKEDEEEARGER